MTRNLHDKVALITGASSGIGAATARACADAGMDLVLAARREDKLHDVAREIEQRGRRALVVACDVTRDDDVQRLFDTAWQHFARLDVLIANAGYGLNAGVLETTDPQHRDIFETNYFGTIRCIRAGVPQLRQTRDGLRQVMIVSSAASEIGLPMYGAYSATKAAQDSIAGALRGELAGEGIAVTSVHPVGTRTAFFDVAAQLGGREPAGPNTPEAFTQQPEQVAKAMVKAIRHPRPEVWPMPTARLGLAFTTAFPRIAAWAMRRHAKQYEQP